MKLIILTPIAERDVHFYLKTAQTMGQQKDLKFLFLSFFQPGNDLIRQAGYELLDPYPLLDSPPPKHWTVSFVQKEFSIPPLEQMILHEKLTFGLSDSAAVIEKFLKYSFAIFTLLKDVESKNPNAEQKHVLQELAGFVGPLSLFFVSQKSGWTNWMTEPSFFKGRIHLVKNSLNLLIPQMTTHETSRHRVDQYLEKAFKEKVVVAATKDAHHYKDMGLKKVFNATNFTKLRKKIFNKYIRGQKQEFEHIGNHVGRYLQMLFNRLRNEKNYCQLEQIPDEFKMLYFPFHVQLDFSLTIRTPDWLDQLSLIEKILQRLPKQFVLVAKEHPASIGCLDQRRLESLLKNPQFRLLHPMINSHDILAKTTAVVTINSKVGAEALSKGLPVFTFGNAFYTNRGLTPHFSNWENFTAWVSSLSEKKLQSPENSWIQFLQNVWSDSFETELYDLSENNITNFSSGIIQKLELVCH